MFRRISLLFIFVVSSVLLLAHQPALAQDGLRPAFETPATFTPTVPAEFTDLPAAPAEPAPAAAQEKPSDTIVGFGSTLVELIALVGSVLSGLIAWLASFLRARNLSGLANALHGTSTEDGMLDRALNVGMQWCNAKAADLGKVDVKNAVLANAILYMQQFGTGTLKKFRANNQDAILKLLLAHLPEVPPDAQPSPRIFGEEAKPKLDPTPVAPGFDSALLDALADTLVAKLQSTLGLKATPAAAASA
jgi:hypothetical protein